MGGRWLFVAACALAAPLQAQSAPPAATPTKRVFTAAEIAAALQKSVGQTFPGGLVLQGVAADDGNVLVITVSGPDGWRSSFSPQELSDALVGGFCNTSPNFLPSGVRMRVDTLDAGNRLAGPLVLSCPKT